MNDFLKRYFKVSIIIYLIIIPFCFLFKDSYRTILGMGLGLAIRLLLFKLSLYDLDKTLNKNPDAAKRSGNFNYIKRYLIYAITLIASFYSPYTNLYGCGIGLLILSVAIHAINIYDIINSKK